MVVTDTDRRIIGTAVVVFNIFGLFGNLNVIYAHVRLKELRTKYGILLTILVSAHTICLMYELVALVRCCAYLMYPYIFTHCFQLGVMAAISTDMLFSIAAPYQHRMLPNKPYLTLIILPGCIHAIASLTLCFIYMDDAKINTCNLAASFPSNVTQIWRSVGLIFTIITILSYVFSFAILYYKYRKTNFNNGEIERKAMKSLSILIIAFIIERLILISLMYGLKMAEYPLDVIEKAQAYMSFCGLMVYSSTFYVCFARSSEYRRLFWPQIVAIFGFCGVKLKHDRFGLPSNDDPSRIYPRLPELPRSSRL